MPGLYPWTILTASDGWHDSKTEAPTFFRVRKGGASRFHGAPAHKGGKSEAGRMKMACEWWLPSSQIEPRENAQKISAFAFGSLLERVAIRKERCLPEAGRSFEVMEKFLVFFLMKCRKEGAILSRLPLDRLFWKDRLKKS